MIGQGSNLTYQGQWPANSTAFPADAIQQLVGSVSGDLAGSGLAVRNFSTDAPSFSAVLYNGFYGVTITLQVTGLGFNSVDDIISIIRHFVYQEAGVFPASDSIPFVGGSATTQLPNPNAPAPQSGQPGHSTLSSIGQALSGLASGSGWVIGLVGIGMVAAVLLIATAKE